MRKKRPGKLWMTIAFLLTAFSPPPKKIKVFLIGDSTMCLYPMKQLPLNGWGMPFANYFDSSVSIDNRARGGRSTRTFLGEGRWQPIADSLEPGDYVLIQFGHNDESSAPQYADRYTPVPDYKNNLAKFIIETRNKQAIPVLITPVSRRNFDKDGHAKETHVEYTKAVFEVGSEYKVPVIDLDKKSRELYQELGPGRTKWLFIELDSAEHPNYPVGRRDNTHFNEFGARRIAELVLNGLKEQHIGLAEHIVKAMSTPAGKQLIVAQDGTGNYATVQAAFDAIPLNNDKPVIVYVKKGIYREKLHLDPSKDFVELLGESRFNTILTYDDHPGKLSFTGDSINTRTSWSFLMEGNDFIAENITFRNDAGFTAGQAVAVEARGDRAFFDNCRFIGNQDILFLNSERSRQYYRNCYIEGTTDFIFGSATAWFTQCHIHSKKNSHITAASTPQEHTYGYVFYDCTLTGDSTLQHVSLGRPWRPYASVLYLHCFLDKHIMPEGWANWNKTESYKTARYAEYGNYGPGAAITARVPWSRQLPPAEAARVTLKNVLGDWDPLAVTILPAVDPPAPKKTMVVAGTPVNYDEDKVGNYTLPPLLKLKNGQDVTDARAWMEKRRPEILKLFEEQQFGKMPPRPSELHFSVVEKGTLVFGGKAIRKQVTVYFTKDTSTDKMDLLIYLPAGADKPAPLLFTISFSPNASSVDDSGIRPGYLWTKEGRRVPAGPNAAFGKIDPEMFISQGIGFATVYYGDIEPDIRTGIEHGGIRRHYLRGGRKTPGPDEWGAISAWAWGLSRAMDYFVTDKQIDAGRVALQGFSRLGKTVLWTAAHDQRFKMVIASCSGEGGAALSRRNYGETIKHMSDTSRYYYQFAPNWHNYADHPENSPVDAHMLVALIAPRCLLLQTGNVDYWSDPKGEFLAAVGAEPVYKLFDKAGPGTDKMPEATDASLTFNPLGYYMHEGGHAVTPSDWELFILYMKKYL